MTDALALPAAGGEPANLVPRVEGLIDLLGRLAVVLGEEIESIRARQVDRLQPLLERKEALTASTQREMGALGAHGPVGARLEPALRDRLGEALARFRTTVEENARALGIARTAREKLIHAIGDAVRRHRRPVTQYASDGKLARHATTRRDEGVSIALDQKV